MSYSNLIGELDDGKQNTSDKHITATLNVVGDDIKDITCEGFDNKINENDVSERQCTGNCPLNKTNDEFTVKDFSDSIEQNRCNDPVIKSKQVSPDDLYKEKEDLNFAKSFEPINEEINETLCDMVINGDQPTNSLDLKTSTEPISASTDHDADDKCELSFMKEINVLVENDSSDCLIIDMTLLSGNMIALIDYFNKCLKLAEIEECKVMAYRVFPDQPEALTALPGNLIAVGFPDEKKIKIVAQENHLSIKKFIRLGGRCLRIVYTDDQLFVSFKTPVMFQVLDLSGNILRTIRPDKEALAYCQVPRYLVIHETGDSFYVSDKRSKAIVHINNSGRLIGKFTDAFEMAFGMSALPDGSLYVADPDLDIVCRLTSDLTKGRVVWTSSDDIGAPLALAFCSKRDLLFVSHGEKTSNRNIVKIYKFTN